MVKILRKSRGSISKIECFYSPEIYISSLLHQNVKDGIQIQIYNIDNECLTQFSQFISEKVKKNLRKCQAQFHEKLRKLKLKQNDGFLIKKRVFYSVVIKSYCSVGNSLQWGKQQLMWEK